MLNLVHLFRRRHKRSPLATSTAHVERDLFEVALDSAPFLQGVKYVGLGLLAHSNRDLRAAQTQFEHALLSFETLPDTPTKELARACVLMHQAHTALDDASPLTSALLLLAFEAFAAVDTTDETLHYAAQHGLRSVRSYQIAAAERIGDVVTLAQLKEKASEPYAGKSPGGGKSPDEGTPLGEGTPLREMLSLALGATGQIGGGNYGSYFTLLLLQERCRDIALGLIEWINTVSITLTATLEPDILVTRNEVHAAYAGARCLLSSLPDDNGRPEQFERQDATDRAWLFEAKAHLFEALGDAGAALESLQAADRYLHAFSASRETDQLRGTLLIEQCRLLAYFRCWEDAHAALDSVVELLGLSTSLRRLLAHSRASLFLQQNDLMAALAALLQAAHLASTPYETAHSWVQIGSLYVLLGQHTQSNEALDRAEMALREMLREFDPRTNARNKVSRLIPRPVLEAGVSLNRAEMLRAQSLRPANARQSTALRSQAKEAFYRARGLVSGLVCTDAREIALAALVGHAAVVAVEGSLDEAELLYQQAQEEAERWRKLANTKTPCEIVNRSSKALFNIRLNRAALLCRGQRFGEALLLLNELLDHSEEEVVSSSQLALLHFLRGGALDATGNSANIPEVIKEYQSARNAYEELSLEVRPELLGSFQETHSGLLYARLARVLLRAGQPWEALGVVEGGRSQGLARRLRSNLLASAQIATRVQSPLTGTKDDSTCHPHCASIDELRRVAEKRPSTLFLIWQLLDTSFGSDRALIFCLQGTHLTAWEEDYGVPLKSRITRFRDILMQSSHGQSPLRLQDEVNKQATSLFQLLLGSIERTNRLPSLSGGGEETAQRLCIVADGPLHNLPWGALRDSEGHFLIERCPISCSPSLATFNLPRPREASTGSLLRVIYDPYSDGTDGKGGPAPVPPIHQIRVESQWLAKHWPGSTELLESEMTRNDVMRTLNQGNWETVHFALHGFCDEGDGLQSYLVLKGDENQRADYMYAWQIAQLCLSARLTVLSACDTGKGQISGSEGLLGLTWAFRAAGCPSTLATLWPVRDDVMPFLIAAFYSHIQRQASLDEALRRAVLSLLHSREDTIGYGLQVDPLWKHPYFWAGIQLWGDVSD